MSGDRSSIIVSGARNCVYQLLHPWTEVDPKRSAITKLAIKVITYVGYGLMWLPFQPFIVVPIVSLIYDKVKTPKETNTSKSAEELNSEAANKIKEMVERLKEKTNEDSEEHLKRLDSCKKTKSINNYDDLKKELNQKRTYQLNLINKFNEIMKNQLAELNDNRIGLENFIKKIEGIEKLEVDTSIYETFENIISENEKNKKNKEEKDNLDELRKLITENVEKMANTNRKKNKN